MDEYTQSTGKQAYERLKEVLKFYFGLPPFHGFTFRFDETDFTCFIYNQDREVCCEFIATNSKEWRSFRDFFDLIQGMRGDDVEVSRIMNEAVGTAVVLKVRRVFENMMQNNGQGSPKKKKNRCSFM